MGYLTSVPCIFDWLFHDRGGGVGANQLWHHSSKIRELGSALIDEVSTSGYGPTVRSCILAGRVLRQPGYAESLLLHWSS